MTLAHVTKWFAIEDAKIAKMLTDPAGGSATYGSSIDVPGIKRIDVTFAVSTKQLRGDNKLLDRDSTITGITVAFERAKLSLDEMAIILGGTTTDSGTTPNQIAKYRHLGASRPNYFKLEGESTHVDVGLGDGHLFFPKLILSGNYGLGFTEEDYRTFPVTCESIPRTADDVWFDLPINETAAALT